jgi:hypothetical protein
MGTEEAGVLVTVVPESVVAVAVPVGTLAVGWLPEAAFGPEDDAKAESGSSVDVKASASINGNRRRPARFQFRRPASRPLPLPL